MTTNTSWQPETLPHALATAPLIRISRLQKRYGDFIALHDINLDIAEGEVVVVVGP